MVLKKIIFKLFAVLLFFCGGALQSFAKVSSSDFRLNPFPNKINRGKLTLFGTFNKRKVKAIKIYRETSVGLVKSVKVNYQGNRFRATLHFKKPGKYTVEAGVVYKDKGWQMGYLGKVAVESSKPIVEPPFNKKTTVRSASKFRRIFFNKLNWLRKKYKVNPLKWDYKLNRIAKSHSRICARKNYFAHNTPWDGTPKSRGRRVGYYYIGENMSGGKTPERSLNGLFNSIAHRGSMLNPLYTKVGIGVSKRKKGGYIVTVNYLSEAAQLRKEKKYKRALKLMKRNLLVIKNSIWNTQNSLKVRLYKSMGWTYVKTKNYPNALRFFQQAYQLEKKDVSILKGLAQALWRTNQFRNAIAFLKKVEELLPGDKKNLKTLKVIYYLMARSYDKKNQFEQANAVYREIIEKYPDYMPAYKMYAYNLSKQKNFDKSIEICNNALKVKPGEKYFIDRIKYLSFMQAYALYKKEDYSAAIEQFEKNIKLYPRETKNHQMLGWAYYRIKEFVKAYQIFKTALDIEPGNQKYIKGIKSSLKGAAYAYYKEESFDEAISYLKKLIQRFPKDIGAHRTMAWSYYKKEEYETANQYFLKTLMLQPDDKSAKSGLKSCEKKLK